jgi:hypothetical protein
VLDTELLLTNDEGEKLLDLRTYVTCPSYVWVTRVTKKLLLFFFVRSSVKYTHWIIRASELSVRPPRHHYPG